MWSIRVGIVCILMSSAFKVSVMANLLLVHISLASSILV